jgi:hypothetical protein
MTGFDATCSLCGNTLTAMRNSLTGEPLYGGVVCTGCKRVICLDCLKKRNVPLGRPCPECVAQVLPATLDVMPASAPSRANVPQRTPNVPMKGATYLYLLQCGKAPSQDLMTTVLDWWRSQRPGEKFEILGGQRVDTVPANADMYVMGLLRGLCTKYAFIAQPDKLGYSTITHRGETIGICRFIN